MKPLNVLGIMSGTSIDAVDYALCRVSERRIELLEHRQARFPAALQHRLHSAARSQSASHETAQLHHDLGRFYAHAAVRFFRKTRLELIGLHGQTIFHQPSGKEPATLQIGEAAYLVESLRTPVVSNFRAADLAAGGQGAPLATLFHRIVFGRPGSHVCVNNLGGISNVTSLDWVRRTHPRILAFDTGPANVLLDLAVQRFTAGKRKFDSDGRMAARGKISEKILARWLRHKFFHSRPPKSTGREIFGESFLETALAEMRRAGMDEAEALANFTELTARSIALNYSKHLPLPPQSVVLCGGGASNGFLASRIRMALQRDNADVSVSTSDEMGWPNQAVEPAAFALLAYYRWNNLAANFPATTGASRPVLLGQISEP